MITVPASPLDNISYDGPLRPLGARQLVGHGDRLLASTREQWQSRVLGARARGRPLELRAVLLGRGRGGRRPVALHRRRAARGAEVLPRHPAGGRGAPRGLLRALHERGRGHRRRHRGHGARRHPAAAHVGLQQGVRPARDDVATSCARTGRCPSSRRRSRSTTSSSRPRSPSPASTSSRATSRTATSCRASARGCRTWRTDEQRHIGFGVKMLSDLGKQDPEVPPAVADLLREVIPWTAAVLMPPNWDERYTECFGFTIEDIGEEGADVARDQDAHAPACRSRSCPARPSSRSPAPRASVRRAGSGSCRRG